MKIFQQNQSVKVNKEIRFNMRLNFVQLEKRKVKL